MDTSGRRLGWVMAAALLLVSLNVLLVVSGAADGIYGKLPGMRLAEEMTAAERQYAASDSASVSGECSHVELEHQPLSAPLPGIVVAVPARVKAC